MTAALMAGTVTVPALAAENATPTTTITTSAVTADDAAVRASVEAERQAAAAAAERAERREARARAKAKRLAAQRRAARAARDMVGIEPSLYRGRFYVKRHEPVRRCIVKRESGGYYRIENRSSSAAGAYQFLQSTSDYVARKMGRRDLVGVPASRWNRLEQDQAFWTLWNRGHGRGHWAGGNYSC